MSESKQPPQYKRFLRGPVPMSWPARASQIGGNTKAAALAWLIWYERSFEKNDTGLTIKGRDLKKFGISRYSYYRAILALEKSGIIRVTRRRKARALIDIISVPDDFHINACPTVFQGGTHESAL